MIQKLITIVLTIGIAGGAIWWGETSLATRKYQVAHCPQCEQRAVFAGPDRTRPGKEKADWAWFDCDHCKIRFMVRDNGEVTVPR